MDRPDLSMMNPRKKDNVYVGKVDGERRYQQKRYLLWPMRDILNILNMYDAEESYVQAFEEFARTVGFYEWKRGDNGYMMKSQVTLSSEDALTLWNSKVQRLKEHIFTKRQQQSKISYPKTNIKVNEVLIHVDYSKNYKSQDQNEIQSAYFRQTSFSLFTANEIKTMSTTITSEASDESRMASITCAKKVIDHVLSKIVNRIDMIYIVSDGCASQFRSKFVFKLLTPIHPEIGLEWHYNEAHHGKGPMDEIGDPVKNTVFRKVLSGEVVIGSPEEFA